MFFLILTNAVYVVFEIRRITVSTEKPVEPSAKLKSAEADHRRQAVIAAAEAREKAHKAKSKPIKLVTKTTLARQQQQQEQQQQQSAALVDDAPRSEQAKLAAAAAKQGEAALAQQLGYNPYEPARATAGQARNATVTAQHGSLSATAASSTIPTVAPPTVPVEAVGEEELLQVPHEFQEALATMVSTSSPDLVQSTCGIMKKLILNAITKGQTPNDDAAKFRKVRLANPKIKAALVDVPGAVEVMLSTGFSLQEQEGESVLIFPPDYVGPDWLPSAMKQLDVLAAGQ